MRLKILILLFIPIGLFGQANLKLVRTNDSTFTITNQETPEDTLWKFSADYLIRYESNTPTDTLGTGSNIFDYISVSDSIGLGGVYIDGFDDSENYIVDSITTNRFSLNGSAYLDTIYSLADIGSPIKTAVEGSEFDNITTTEADVDTLATGYITGVNDSLIVKGKLISDYYIGQLYTDDGTVTITTTPVDTYFTITGLTSDITVNTTLTDSTITIASDGSGYYNVYGGFSYTHSTNATICHASLFVNDVEYTVSEAQRKIGTGGDFGDAGRSAIVWLNGGDVLKFKMKGDKTGTLTINHGNINVSRIN